MQIEYIPISECISYENNPRRNDKAIEIVEKSIKSFGFKNPIILDKNNVIVAGHTRLEAAKKLGLTEVPVIWADDLNEEQVKAFRIMDNKSQEYSIWDEEKIVEEFHNIGDELMNTGFSEKEIDYLLNNFDLNKEKIYSDIEDFNPQDNNQNIREGDLIILENKHKIICGDSRDENTIKQLMNGQKIDLVVTSPPYNLEISYGKYKDNKDIREYLEDMSKIMGNIRDFINKGRFICLNIGREWGPLNLSAKWDSIMDTQRYTFFRNIYWKKPAGSTRGTITSRNPFPRFYIPKVETEVISIYQFEPEQPEFMDLMVTYKFGEGERDKDEQIPKILLQKYAGNVWEMMTETKLSGTHSAPFPIQLPLNCIQFFTKENENVMDCFVGSGTSLIATDQLKRRFFGIELDPGYCSVIIERYKKYKENAIIEVVRSEKQEITHPESPEQGIEGENEN